MQYMFCSRQSDQQECREEADSFQLEEFKEGLWRMWHLNLALHDWLEIGRGVMGLEGILDNVNSLSRSLEVESTGPLLGK